VYSIIWAALISISAFLRMRIKNTLFNYFKKRNESSCRLIMTLLTRDNDDVLRANIDFHLSQGVDFIIAMDNLSTDNTREILLSYQERGVLHYIYQPSKEFNQAKWVTQMARMAKKSFGATWVINNDSDEFWWVTDTSYKEVESFNVVDEVLPPKVAHIGHSRVKVGAGSHSVAGLGRLTTNNAGIEVFHFPFRSQEQLIQKIRIIGGALESKAMQENTYTTWRKLSQELQDCDNVNEFVSKYSYTEQQINDSLDSGKLVKDTRLKQYLNELKTCT